MIHSELISPPGFPSLAVTGRGFALIGLPLLMTSYGFTFASASEEGNAVPVVFYSQPYKLSQLASSTQRYGMLKTSSADCFS